MYGKMNYQIIYFFLSDWRTIYYGPAAVTDAMILPEKREGTPARVALVDPWPVTANTAELCPGGNGCAASENPGVYCRTAKFVE